ncbi:MAG TPA: ATP-binding cassette domain-containing protein [Solirubrobacteraceae bacterium]|nr:ATP-binding cassette domain-containing protein [Solirubrobacteraceae bacterium]
MEVQLVEYAIEAESLVKSYPKGVTALDGLSFAVASGSVFALLGPNGAGKSTAVKVLTTLTTPDAGRGMVAGIDVTKQPDRVRRTIGVVAQGSGVDIQATGRENLRLQGQIHGLRSRPPSALQERTQELLERFGLADAADRIARGYSGGMQRRLDIAMALVHDPTVLFLDEPTTGLDPEVRADMWSEIAKLAAERGKTVLLTTHYLEEADQLAERVAIVDRGKVVAEGTPEELKRELRGDAIHVDLDHEYNGRVTGALSQLEAVRDVTVDGKTLRARADDGGRAVPLVLQALESHGVRVSSVRVARPSLDDVYLKYTGRTFDAAEAEQEEAK